MTHFPAFDRFVALAAPSVKLVPIYRRLTSDTLTPVNAFRRIDQGGGGCLFESVIGGEQVGRYSFLASGPFLELEAFDRTVVVRRGKEEERFTAADPLADLEARVAEFTTVHLPELPPFCGGVIGYAGYDTVRYIEDLPNAPADDRGLPDMSFAFYDSMVVFDHIEKTVLVIALARLDKHAPEAAYRDACGRVDALVKRLSDEPDRLTLSDFNPVGGKQPPFESNFTRAGFEAAVEKCLEYIRAGDIFQVVVSQRLQTPLACDPFEVYRTLRMVNPSPFMFFLRTGGCTLVGSSPEILVRVVDGEATTRPLAGTRPRGATPEEDRRLSQELLADPKERAEHVMLVDLGRNDVGRVAEFGTVRIPEVMVVERYSHVMHISSTVVGKLAAGRTAFDALRACLPVGTVSGAPKVRAMQIIDEVEPHRRGPYAGAVGYIDFCGNMDTCIALRTIVVCNGQAYIQAGAGVVADSVPASEYEETLNKARGLLRAVQLTEERLRPN